MMSCVTCVSVSPSSKTLVVGETVLLTAAVRPANAACCGVVWSSGNPAVVTVNPDTGLVRAQQSGTTYIYADALDGSGFYGVCHITVNDPILVSEIMIDSGDVDVTRLRSGDSFRLTATVFPENATNKALHWESTDTNVAYVDYYTGCVTIRSEGSATIYAIADDEGAVGNFCDLVVKKFVTDVRLSQSTMVLNKGEEKWLFATIAPSDATNKSLRWESANVSVATVLDGIVYGINVGTTVIRAVSTDGTDISDECAVTVLEINGMPASMELHPGETIALTLTINPPLTLDPTITWGTDDPMVATVSQGGLITAIGEGNTIITATVEGVTVPCHVAVVRKKVVISSVTEYGQSFKKVQFFSKDDVVEKTWICVEHDLIFDTSKYYSGDLRKWQRFALNNCYDNYVFYDPPMGFGTFLTYSPEELKFLYAIDPHGVAFYVHQYGADSVRILPELDTKEERLLATLNFKDNIFETLFGRSPKYYICDYQGNFYETSSSANRINKYSEAEGIFGFHQRDWQAYIPQLFAFSKAVATLLYDIMDALIPEPTDVIKLAVGALSLGTAAMQNRVANYMEAYELEEAVSKTRLNWIADIFELYDSFNGLVAVIGNLPNFTVPVINYCANNSLYRVFIKHSNGYLEEMYPIADDE